MKHRFLSLIAGAVLLAALPLGAAGPKESARSSSPGPLSWGPGSPYIEVAIDDTSGQFTMGVPGGPVILYGHPSPWSSFSSIQVDGTVYTNDGSAFGTPVQPPTNTGDTNEAVWMLGSGPLRVRQRIRLVTSTTTGRADTYFVSYTVENLDSAPHVVGCRIMLDTKIGANDNAPFQVPGTGAIPEEREWTGASIPPYFFVFDDLYNPTTTCQGTLLGGLVPTAPDRFQVADWSYIHDQDFAYTVDPQRTIHDTAYAVYWENRTLVPGGSLTFGTYYGLGSIAVDTPPPVATALTAPSVLDCINHLFSPNPFTVSLYLSNTLSGSSGTVTGLSATLNLPAGLALAAGSATQTVGDLPLQAAALVSWQVSASGTVTGPLSYTIQVASTNAGSKTVPGQVTVPPGCQSTCPATLLLNQVDTSACPTVKAVVSVLDGAGGAVTGLTASDFCLREDGAPVTGFTVTTGSSGGGDLFAALVVDNSGSLGSSAFADEKNAAKAFVALLGPSDQAAFYGFTSTVDLVMDFTADKQALSAAIDGYPYKGGNTAFYDGVYQALSNTATRSGRKAVVAMTDGKDNSSHHSQSELVSYARSLGIPVFTIGFGSADQAVLSDIATRTGGLFFTSASSQNLQQILSAIGNLLNSKYVVSYTTTKTDGALHNLRFCVTYGGCTRWVQGTFRCGPQGACPAITIAQVDPSRCPTVQAVVSVFDSQGHPVQGLTASSFCLNEDGVPQNFTVTGAGQSGSTLYVGITVDNSGSLGSSQFQLEKDAAKTFIGLLGASDQAAVWGFDSRVDLVMDFTADKQALYAAIDGYAYRGGTTAFFDATWNALVATAAKTGRKAVLAMTDGEDNSSSHSEGEIIAYAQQAHIPIYTIGFGSPDDTVMQRIADQTGGKYYRGTDAGALQQILTDIGNLINNQYVLSYDTLYTDGSVHDLEICVTYQGCTAYAHAASRCGNPCAVTCQAWAPTSAFTGVPVAFFGQAASSCGTGAPGYEWNFGDGSALAASQNPTHAYASPGTYTWTFTATSSGAAPCVQSGTVTVTNASCVKPRITTQPQSQVVLPGASVTLSVTAQGTTALSYQWYEGPSGSTANPVAGATQSTFTTGPIQATRQYWVKVSASCGTTNSQTATLAVASDAFGWGDNNSGQLGNGSFYTDSAVPIPVLGPPGFVQVAAGSNHFLGLKSDGTVWA